MKNTSFKKNIIIHLIVFVLFVLPSISVYAQQTRLQNPTGAPGTSADNALVPCTNNCTIDDFAILIENIVNLVFLFAGFIVAVMFMYAGFLMITSAGDMSKIQKARTIFKRVVIGFLIMFGSFLLVRNFLEKIGLTTQGGIKNWFMQIIR